MHCKALAGAGCQETVYGVFGIPHNLLNSNFTFALYSQIIFICQLTFDAVR
jgi:hypothetical protein